MARTKGTHVAQCPSVKASKKISMDTPLGISGPTIEFGHDGKWFRTSPGDEDGSTKPDVPDVVAYLAKRATQVPDELAS